MKRILKYSIHLVLLQLFFQGCEIGQPIEKPEKLLFNEGWEFIIAEDSSTAFSGTAQWEAVSLPHTPVIESLIVNNQWQGICWYRKIFTLPKTFVKKNTFLKFEGCMTESDVWINGTRAGHHKGGYLPFILDISNETINQEQLELIVRLDNTDNPITGPKPLNVLDFNTYGGIYRDVWLISKNSVFITDPILEEIPGGGGIFISYPEVSKELAIVDIKIHLRNTSLEDSPISVEHQLWDGPDQLQTLRSGNSSLGAESADHFKQQLEVYSPKLWSPQSPQLYSLITHVFVAENIMDSDTTLIGIKNVEFIDNKLVLNGQKLFLRGVNRHQEYPYVGYALSNEAQYRDAIKIKEAGFDYVRLSHYPHSTTFMKACDEIGLLVVDAILGWQYYSEDEEFQQHIYQTARDLIRRDRNHASVLAWEVSLNESWMPEPFIDSLHAIAHTEYPGKQCFSAGWQSYGYDIYLQARQHRLSHYTPPKKPYVVSEYGDWEYYAMNAGLSQDTWDGLLEEERTSRQALSSGEKRMLQQATNIQEAHNDNFNTPAFADGYWVMFDYNRGYADDHEMSGIMSINRLPKFSYYFFQSQRDANEISELYSSGPMVYIASYWNDESKNKVTVYSNCEEVALYLNDSLIDRLLPDNNRISNHLAHAPFTFELAEYIPGTLKAVGIINGKELIEFERTTPGKPYKLHLSIDESGKKPKSGVNDVVFVYASMLDENANPVPVNGVELEFSVTGDARFISPKTIQTEAGIATALLQIGKTPGPISITAKGSNLQAKELTMISN